MEGRRARPRIPCDIDATRFRALLTATNLVGDLDGSAVARNTRELVPSLPVVYLSSSGRDTWQAQGVPGSVLIEKPYASAQIVTAVSMLLNRQSRH